MTILEKLNLTEQTRSAAVTSPEARLLAKMLEGIDLQISAAKAMLNGETFIRRAPRWIEDPETGDRVRKDMPVRFRPWYWKDEQGNYMLEIRYANKRIELKPKKTAIEVGNPRHLVLTLELLRDAVNAGELDKILDAFRKERAAHSAIGHADRVTVVRL